MKDMTFTTLKDLKSFLSCLSEIELESSTGEHDWYTIEVDKGFYVIRGFEGGEE